MIYLPASSHYVNSTLFSSNLSLNLFKSGQKIWITSFLILVMTIHAKPDIWFNRKQHKNLTHFAQSVMSQVLNK